MSDDFSSYSPSAFPVKITMAGFTITVREPAIEYDPKAQHGAEEDPIRRNMRLDIERTGETHSEDTNPAHAAIHILLPGSEKPKFFLEKLAGKLAQVSSEKEFENVAAVQQAIAQASGAILNQPAEHIARDAVSNVQTR